MAQIFMTYAQQLQKLQNDKGLIIPHPSESQKILEEISYYSLIGGYKKLFLHPSSKKYKYGVTFDEIVAFYHFDEQLRSLFLKYILQVERHIKSMISYHFCDKYGESQSEYLNPNNFDYSQQQKQVTRLISSLNKTISLPSNYRYITHHARKYNNIPLWVATNAMTMGQISAFYQYMTNDLQVKVSKVYPNYTEKQLHQFITVIAKYRNVCAHGERLYNFRTTDMIPDTLLHAKLSIPKKKNLYIYGKNDLFAVVISLRYLIRDDEFRILKKSLSLLIKQVLSKCPHLTKSQILNEMGFPDNWDKIVRYKK
ncbi:MAG: Abi family protein [Lachnospiraceae bacterium]|nr:Abi family protein [Lachnospiraceae bacterium]